MEDFQSKYTGEQVDSLLTKAGNAFTGTVNYKSEGPVVAIEKIIMNNKEYTPQGSETHVNLGDVLTEHQDISGKLDETEASTTYLTKSDAATNYLGINAKAASATTADSATKATQDGSGNNIAETYATKTDLSRVNAAYALVNHGTGDATFTLTPNVFHVWDVMAALTLTFGSETEGVTNEYLFQFSCSSSVATTLSLPSSVMWADGEAPTIEVMKTYQVSILNNCATIQSFG